MNHYIDIVMLRHRHNHSHSHRHGSGEIVLQATK